MDSEPGRPVSILAPGAEGAGMVRLPGALTLPAAGLSGVVVFAHGSGSSRLSPRNAQVAATLNGGGLGTLVFDLLTEEEAVDRTIVFDIPLLADRLASATRWLLAEAGAAGRSIGYFGASTGAAAALWAAPDFPDAVRAVVSRGGRPDLAEPRLPEIAVPVLLIVGGRDREVLELNRAAGRLLRSPWELAVIPGATHLFEEPGAMEEVADLAGQWFERHLRPG